MSEEVLKTIIICFSTIIIFAIIFFSNDAVKIAGKIKKSETIEEINFELNKEKTRSTR